MLLLGSKLNHSQKKKKKNERKKERNKKGGGRGFTVSLERDHSNYVIIVEWSSKVPDLL
jgi:hypothetical protein